MSIRTKITSALNRMPYIRTLRRKLDMYERELLIEPGHFYSPLINHQEITAAKNVIFETDRSLNAIDLNLEEQKELLEKFKVFYSSLPFTDTPNGDNRYHYLNDAYSYSDGIFLYCMLNHFKPKKIIEIGSGHSSALMLDTNDKHFNGSIDLTFIEPFPETLMRTVKKGDAFTLIEKKVQDVDLQVFSNLDENDILFIDSTHVAKTNSDVLFEIFEILPVLKKGVKIHIHDIFFPFEYPEKWVIEQKRNWNETYFLRAFLMYNKQFKIIAFNTFLEAQLPEWFTLNMPLCLKDPGGSIWLEKI